MTTNVSLLFELFVMLIIRKLSLSSLMAVIVNNDTVIEMLAAIPTTIERWRQVCHRPCRMEISRAPKTSCTKPTQRSLTTRSRSNTLEGLLSDVSLQRAIKITVFPMIAVMPRSMLIAEREIPLLSNPWLNSSEQ